MATWSGLTLTLLYAPQIGPLLAPPLADHLDTSLANITGAVSAQDASAGDQLRKVIDGRKDVTVLEAASDRCRVMNIEFLARVHQRLDEGEDQIPPEINGLVKNILRGGVAAAAPRSLEVGGAAADLPPRHTEMLGPKVPGGFSTLLHGEIDESTGVESDNILNRAVEELISLDLKGENLSAERIARLAQELVTVVRAHLERLVACLTPVQKKSLMKIARDNLIPIETAQVEYLTNVCLFKVLRDYFGLQQATYLPMGTPNGFILLTANGSVVASAPSPTSARRAIHYSRMPSRDMRLQTGVYQTYLRGDIDLGHEFQSERLRTSPVVEIVVIPRDKTNLFAQAFTLASEGTFNVSVLVSQVKGQK